MMETLSPSEASRLIAARDLSPVELTRSCLERIEAFDPVLHSFVTVTAETALEAGSSAEMEIMANGPRSPLRGIPVGLKDIINTAGVRPPAHSRLLADNVPDTDATCVRALREAGAVLVGKLATHEFAVRGPSFDLPWPPARNPWNVEHFTAGSSSGAGAAVAGDLVLGAVGTDSGGSIRAPAALCGIAGLKPTYGLVSRKGVLPLSPSLDHVVPMAWCVEDLALMLDAVAGYDAADPGSANRPAPGFTGALRHGVEKLRIGVVRHFHEKDLNASPRIRANFDEAVAVFQTLGAEIVDVSVPPLAEWHACGMVILIAEGFACHEPWLRERYFDHGELMRTCLVLGATLSATDYIQACRRRRELNSDMAVATRGCDLVVCAGSLGEAPRLTDVQRWGLFSSPILTFPFNLCGWPALSVCSGFGANGLPLAIQIAGPPFTDATVLQAGHAYEQATAWRSRRPALKAVPR